MGVSVRSVLRECTVPCGCRSGLGIPARSFVQGLTEFGEARELGYIYQAKHDYVTFDPLVPGKLLTGLLWARNHR